MKIWHVCAMFVVIIVILYVEASKPPEMASNYIVIGIDKRIKYHDSIASMDSCGGSVVMIRFDDTIRINSVVDVRKLCTYKIKKYD